MVTVRIVVEGGVLSCNAETTTANNTESLRQSLHSFFTRLLSRDDISIVISIADHNLISGKNIEDISKPSAVVAILLKHFFEKRIDGKKRKLAVYGKLRTAPVLLDCLDVALLETQDSELVRFKNIMNKNFIMKL